MITAQRKVWKFMNYFCLKTFSFNYFVILLALSCFFLVAGFCYLWYLNWFKYEASLTLDARSEAYSEPFQTSKIQVFTNIVIGFSLLTIFAKSSILDVWQDSEFTSETSNNLPKKLRISCLTGFWIHLLIIFAKPFTICSLNLINMFHYISVLCTIKSTCPYFEHICLITKIILVFPNHVFV